jgi:hypothetical protein
MLQPSVLWLLYAAPPSLCASQAVSLSASQPGLPHLTSMCQCAGSTAAQKLLANQLSLMQQQEEAADRRELEGLLVAELLLDITSRLCGLTASTALLPSGAGSSDRQQQAGASTSEATSSSSTSYLDTLRPLQVHVEYPRHLCTPGWHGPQLPTQ